MKKNALDRYLICDLYQVSEKKGYIKKYDIHDKWSISRYFDDKDGILNKIGEVIVEKKGLSIFNLREIITGIPLNTLYEIYNDHAACDWFKYTVSGSKKEYDTFILVSSPRNKFTLDKLHDYLNEHKNALKYKYELVELIERGETYSKRKKDFEKSENRLIKKRIRDAIKAGRNSQDI